ncbi:MAG: NAD(+) synthase [Desulfuromonadaceae bacterium]
MQNSRSDSDGAGNGSKGTAMKQNLDIDTSLTVQLMGSYLKDLLAGRKNNGLLLGFSGGIDSALLATLAIGAVGKDAVHLSFLYDRDTAGSTEEKARMMADWLGVDLEVTDISPAMEAQKVYAPPVMRLVSCSARFNRMFQHCYRLVIGETPFKTTLRVGSGLPEHSWLKRFMFNRSIRYIEQGFSARHRYRRRILEEKAAKENLVLIGAANRSELEVGWFVKDGIDDLPIQPMIGLYKTQLRQLASYLGLPDTIRTQHPSPDMLLGITDEFAIGYSYGRLDLILDLLEQQLPVAEMVRCGVTAAEINDVREIMQFSEWKRASGHESPPVQGGIRGNVRLTNLNRAS